MMIALHCPTGFSDTRIRKMVEVALHHAGQRCILDPTGDLHGDVVGIGELVMLHIADLRKALLPAQHLHPHPAANHCPTKAVGVWASIDRGGRQNDRFGGGEDRFLRTQIDRRGGDGETSFLKCLAQHCRFRAFPTLDRASRQLVSGVWVGDEEEVSTTGDEGSYFVDGIGCWHRCYCKCLKFEPLLSLMIISEEEWKNLPQQSAGLVVNIKREGIPLWPQTPVKTFLSLHMRQTMDRKQPLAQPSFGSFQIVS